MRISKIELNNSSNITTKNRAEQTSFRLQNPNAQYSLPASYPIIRFGSKATALSELFEGAAKVCETDKKIALFDWERDTTKISQERLKEVSKLSGELSVLKQEQIKSPLIERPIEYLQGRDDLSDFEKALVKVWHKKLIKAKSVPAELAREKTELESVASNVWALTKKINLYTSFAPYLAKLAILAKREAEYINPNQKPLDTMLDYTGYTSNEITALFDNLMGKLSPLTKKIIEKQEPNKSRYLQILKRPVSDKKWRSFSLDIAENGMGLDMSKVRLGETEHSFLMEFDSPREIGMAIKNRAGNIKGANDVRQSFMHESGHGLVELGASPKLYRTGLTGVFLDLHESQSRLWENLVGGSKEFWQHYYPKLQKEAGDLDDIDFEDFYHAINYVEKSPIRTEADEVTYNSHIVFRHKIETMIFDPKNSDKDIEKIIADAPEIWNDLHEQYLGFRPNVASEGILQDVHWSEGLFGYFPSYGLGNLEGAQIMEAVRKEIPDLNQKIASGDLKTLGNWLRENIYQYGMTYNSVETMQRLTGKPLDSDAFINYLSAKYL